jgi:hypothetical protein
MRRHARSERMFVRVLSALAMTLSVGTLVLDQARPDTGAERR